MTFNWYDHQKSVDGIHWKIEMEKHDDTISHECYDNCNNDEVPPHYNTVNGMWHYTSGVTRQNRKIDEVARRSAHYNRVCSLVPQ